MRRTLQLRNCEEEKEIIEYARKEEDRRRGKMEDKKRLEEMMAPRGTREMCLNATKDRKKKTPGENGLSHKRRVKYNNPLSTLL